MSKTAVAPAATAAVPMVTGTETNGSLDAFIVNVTVTSPPPRLPFRIEMRDAAITSLPLGEINGVAESPNEVFTIVPDWGINWP